MRGREFESPPPIGAAIKRRWKVTGGGSDGKKDWLERASHATDVTPRELLSVSIGAPPGVRTDVRSDANSH